MKELNWKFTKYADLKIENDKLEEAVLNVFEIKKEQLYSKSRKRPIMSARKVMMYYMRKNKHTYQFIGYQFNCNHENVMHHVKSHEDLLLNKVYSNKVLKVIQFKL